MTGLPYDRPATTMAAFAMCPACAREYADPADRRFHAQPIACHDCGPRLWLAEGGEAPSAGASAEEVLARARRLLADGAVLAVKGLGGYHLACDAGNEAAVARLRRRKRRGDKPFAVMVPDLDAAAALVHLEPAAAAILTGPRRPIVLAPRRDGGRGRPLRGAPASPTSASCCPTRRCTCCSSPPDADGAGPAVLVMTSGNLGGEPIVTDDAQARDRLAPLADAWLGHDRRIHVPCDDSVVRVVDGEEVPLRRSRGYAPLPLALPFEVPATLAVGADLKNTFALAEGRYAWLGQHIGEMDDVATLEAFGAAERHLELLTGVRPVELVRRPAPRATARPRGPGGTPRAARSAPCSTTTPTSPR